MPSLYVELIPALVPVIQARGADAGEAGGEKRARAGGRVGEGKAAEETGPRAAADSPKAAGR